MASPLLVLCVDSAPEILIGYRIVLSIAGYEVLTAGSGEDALTMFRDYPIGIVVANEALPGLSGTRLSRKMKRLKPDIPIVLLTSTPELPRLGSDAVDLFISKDSYPTEFLESIAKVIATAAA